MNLRLHTLQGGESGSLLIIVLMIVRPQGLFTFGRKAGNIQ